AAFGPAGFGVPEITDLHASPSKTGNNSEPLTYIGCCEGSACTVSIDLTVLSGQSPFTYLWSNGETTQDLTNACAGEYTVTVTDANGCSSATSITVEQEEEGIIVSNQPDDVIVDCTEDIPAVINPVFTDACLGVLPYSYMSVDNTINTCADEIVRTWMAYTDCDTATVVQVITISSNEAATITVPAGGTINCNETPSFGTPTIDENCSNNTGGQTPPSCNTTVNLDIEDGNQQPTRVLNFGDVLCINGSGTYYGTIKVQNGGHVIVCGNATILGSVAIQPGGSYWHSQSTGFIGSLAVYGNEYIGEASCGGSQNEVTITSQDSQTGNECSGSYTRTWTATDDCDNTYTASQTFTYSDDEAPSITAPAGGVIACDASPVFGTPTYDDNCSSVTISSVDSSTGDDCAGSYTRTWTATDACDNSAVASQTFTYSDDEAPSITA
ncbi:MAG: hypothetical protein GY918_10790, partial [Gammaproteobacteria bacterium]|nr:hypothetical protein [Gammaproteobacteria bacterium]